jgi:hypothetical protein
MNTLPAQWRQSATVLCAPSTLAEQQTWAEERVATAMFVVSSFLLSGMLFFFLY